MTMLKYMQFLHDATVVICSTLLFVGMIYGFAIIIWILFS